MNENNLKPIEPQKENINLPNLKPTPIEEPPKKEEKITLPAWNIEPPIEINRGQNDIR